METPQQVEEQFFEYLRQQGLDQDQRLLSLPLASKKVMLAQHRRMHPTPPSTGSTVSSGERGQSVRRPDDDAHSTHSAHSMHSAYASDPANQQPLNRSNSATSSFFNRFTVTGKSANKRGSITSTSLSALPSGGPPATLPAAYSADPLYRDKPLPSPAYAPPSYAHAAPYGVPHPDPNSTYAFAEKRPAIAVSEPELRRTFEGILTKLKVTGKTRTQVIEMFSRTNFENKIAIVEKYKDQLAASGIRPISPPPIRQSPMPPVSPTTSVSNPELMRPVAALRDPDYAPVGVSAGRRPSISTETHDWVDRLNGGELDKQLDRVLHGMRITGYARSTVMNSTPVSGKRTMIRQYYEKTKLPPPKDVLDDLERATTPSSPRSPTPSSPRLSAFELFPPTGGDGIAPKASEYYVTLFMDNSTSPKNLLRAVTALRVQLTLNPAPAFLQEFVSSKIYVQSAGGITVTGIEALHHLLSRYNAKAQPQSLQQETAAIKVIKQRYTDASTVQPDEMRVQMLECLAKVPLESLIATEGIISTVVAVLGSTFIVEGTSLAENLALRVHAADLLGRICIDGGDTEGYTLVVNALSKAGGAVDGGELLGEIVASLVEPFVPLVGLRAKSVKRMPDRDPSTSYDVEQSIVWQFRAAVLEMVLGVVGASEDVKERVRMRKVVEAVGFKVVLEGLKNWIESAPGQEGSGSEEKGQVLEVMDLYLEAKGDDLEEFGEVEISKLSNDLVRSPEEIVTALLASFKSLPANQQLTATLILQHVYSLIVAGNQVQSDGHHISPVELLSLTERLTSLAAQTASPTATLTSTDTQGHWTAFTDSNLSAIEAIAGFRISTGKAVPSTVAEIGTADEVGSNATSNARLAKELEELRVQYALSQSIQDDLTQEVVDLKEYISGRMENATHSGDQAVKSAQDEVRRLRDLVAGLTKERDEAVRIAESAVASASMGEENGLVSTTPEGRLRGRETVAITLDKLDLPLSDQSMKPLEWSKLKPKSIGSSVWKTVSKEAYDSENGFAKAVLDVRELGDLPKIFPKSDDSSASTFIMPVSGNKKITLLDPSRAHTIEILLASARGPDMKKLKHQEIKDGILAMNGAVLTTDNLNVLLQVIPTDAEIDLLSSYKGDPTLLGNSEKFVRTISAVPRLRARLEAIAFQQRLSEELAEIKPDLATVHKASKSLMASSRFNKVLQAVLVIGNYINGSTFRGGAYGFEISSLLKLKDTKADDASHLKDRAPTLLHYLARRLEEVDEDLIDLKSEIGPVEGASRVVIDALFSSVQELKTGFEDIKSEITVCEQLGQTDAEPGSSISFYDQMRDFVSKNESRIMAVVQLAESVEREVKEMLTFYGEDVVHRESPPQDFFKTIWIFQDTLQRAYKENLAADEKAKASDHADLYSRRPILTPLQLKLRDKKQKLKAVEGEVAFSKRGMTVRRGRKVLSEEPESFVGNTEPSGSSIKQVLSSRKTLRKIRSAAHNRGESVHDYGVVVRDGIDAVLSDFTTQ